jgi:hypothetical protein
MAQPRRTTLEAQDVAALQEIVEFIAADTSSIGVNDACYCNWCYAQASWSEEDRAWTIGHEDGCLFLEARRLANQLREVE